MQDAETGDDGSAAAASATATEQSTTLLTCSFNQDGGCLAVGTTTGFSVYNLHPKYALTVQRQLQGGIGLVEMLFRCNLMTLVGGGPSPQAPPHRVLIWDDHIPKEIGELSFRQVVLRVKLRKDAVAVALKDRVYVYNLADLSLRDKIYTADNPHGLLCMSTQIQDMVLACPSVTTGHVRVELYGLRKTVLLEAHDGALRGLALTADGSKLATASAKGTVIRLWDVATSSCLQEYRRGVERATITCLAFSWDYSWLACTSDKGTAHVFAVQQPETNKSTKVNNNGGSNINNSESSSSFSQMFFSSVRKSVEGNVQKSVCQIRGVSHPQACAFVAEAPQLLAVAGWDADGNGVLLLSEFAADQEPKRIAYHVLCKSNVNANESDESRRRRRLRGWTPTVPETPEGGRLYIGERLEILEKGMDLIKFEETADEFVSVSTISPNTTNIDDGDKGGENNNNSNNNHTGAVSASSPMDSGVGDSVRTEPLEDEDNNDIQ